MALTTIPNDMHEVGGRFMHALTLAVEADLSLYRKKDVEASAVQIIVLLNKAMAIGVENMELAAAMLDTAIQQVEQLSARGYGGYAQAIGTAVHRNFHTPCGVTEAIILPELLRSYGSKAEPRLASLARQADLVADDLPDDRTARLFVSWIEQQHALFNLPKSVEQIRPQDFPTLIDDTLDATLHFYPTPAFYDAIDLEQFLFSLL